MLAFFQILKKSLLHQWHLTDLFGVDKLGDGCEVNWVFWSYETESVGKLRTITNHQLITTTWLWRSSNWFERECWEMYGVVFVGHPDLRRLLTDYGFRGYPLLKSYPLGGYLQLFYSEKNKRLVAANLTINQEFRQFDFKSPWLS